MATGPIVLRTDPAADPGDRPPFRLRLGDDPVVATAVHAGVDLRPEVSEGLAVPSTVQCMEADLYTDQWTDIAAGQAVALRSRFETDLNRPRSEAVYRRPADAWDLPLWHEPPPPEVVARSQAIHARFYDELRAGLEILQGWHGPFVVFDLHSYNHRRSGPDGPPADPATHPAVNLGTGSMDRARWDPLVERFLASMTDFDFPTGPLDVRENVKFRGRELAAWVHRNFPETGCVLAIEVKKFWMDEHTGRLDRQLFGALHDALGYAAGAVREGLGRW